MPEVETTAGTIEYQDTGGDGHPVVLLHGVLMDAEQWREVVPGLAVLTPHHVRPGDLDRMVACPGLSGARTLDLQSAPDLG